MAAPISQTHSSAAPRVKIRRVSMAADLDKVQQDLDGLSLQDKLHVFDIHTEHNLHPPQDPLPRLSEEVTTFLKDNGENVDDILKKPALKPSTTDNSYPLTDYFISSSHNTYLLAAQILGKSSAGCYTHVLSRGCRCVEIDVWPSKSGPIVTHGYTLSVSVPFADVCRAIGDYINETYGPYNPDIRSGLDFPILVSLECHVPYDQQADLAQTMKEIWGDRLVQGPIEGIDDDWVSPRDLAGRIVVMVEYYPPAILNRPAPEEDTSGSAKPSRKWSLFASRDDSSSSSSSESEDSESDGDYFEGGEEEQPPEKKPKISDELADLGYYARSVKPAKGWLVKKYDDPPHVLINISESACARLLSSIKEHHDTHKHAHPHAHILHLPSPLTSLIHHSSHHMRRIYPKGTRIRSTNLDPSKFWRSGSQVVSLNWQKYDRGMQMNEGLFVGTSGWVLKPDHMRKRRNLEFAQGANAQPSVQQKVKLRGHLVGVSAIPEPNGRRGKTFNTYVRTELFYHREVDPPAPKDDSASTTSKSTSLEEVILRWKSKTMKLQHDPELGADGVWHEMWEWEYVRDELAFVRLLVYEDEFGKDDRISTFCSPVDRLVLGEWLLVRLMNTKGKDIGTTALVKFELDV
ncbi:PLC-like phosphodiesterase [Coprinellus micaceus]|uniref:Phosphoinositide phospholipase C n=1 Tax=Coprinellus micaceus TaxID=71717 RepID=A0A4Y7SYU5_COPMI|nr:PLC-like phosphodiesterase [Coprinellus micaceus]